MLQRVLRLSFQHNPPGLSRCKGNKAITVLLSLPSWFTLVFHRQPGAAAENMKRIFLLKSVSHASDCRGNQQLLRPDYLKFHSPTEKSEIIPWYLISKNPHFLLLNNVWVHLQNKRKYNAVKKKNQSQPFSMSRTFCFHVQFRTASANPSQCCYLRTVLLQEALPELLSEQAFWKHSKHRHHSENFYTTQDSFW